MAGGARCAYEGLQAPSATHQDAITIGYHNQTATHALLILDLGDRPLLAPVNRRRQLRGVERPVAELGATRGVTRGVTRVTQLREPAGAEVVPGLELLVGQIGEAVHADLCVFVCNQVCLCVQSCMCTQPLVHEVS